MRAGDPVPRNARRERMFRRGGPKVLLGEVSRRCYRERQPHRPIWPGPAHGDEPCNNDFGERSKMSTMAATEVRTGGMTSDERFVIFASSLGTIFEWYDFYLYAVLAPFFASLFFPAGNDTAALLSAFATYAAGFLVRPFGALIFGRIGDLVGRKYTFLITIMVMGTSTFLVGLLPTYANIGWLAPALLVTLRLVQGLAVGGEYGGAATYVAEHARPGERGFATSWIQTTATIGLALALVIIIACRELLEPRAFSEWGWRIPFLVSAIL